MVVGEVFCLKNPFDRAYRSQILYPTPDNDEFQIMISTVDIVNMTKDYSLDMSQWTPVYPSFTAFNGNNHTLFLLYNEYNDTRVNYLQLFNSLSQQRIYNLNINILGYKILVVSYIHLIVKSLFGDVKSCYIYDVHVKFEDPTYLIQGESINGVICNKVHKSTFINVGITFGNMIIQLYGNNSNYNTSFGLISGMSGVIEDNDKIYKYYNNNNNYTNIDYSYYSKNYIKYKIEKKKKNRINDEIDDDDYDSDTLTYFIGVYIKGNNYSIDNDGNLHGGAMIGITTEKVVFSYCLVVFNNFFTITSPRSLSLSLFIERSYDYVMIIKSIGIIKKSIKLYTRKDCVVGGFISVSKYNVIIISSWVYVTIDLLAPGNSISMGGLIAQSNVGLCLVKNSYIIVHLSDDDQNIPYISGLFGSIASNRLIISNSYLFFDINENITVPYYLNDIENLLSGNISVTNSFIFSKPHQRSIFSKSNMTIIEYTNIRDNISILMDNYSVKNNKNDETIYYEDMPFILNNHINDPNSIFSNADLIFLSDFKDENDDIIVINNTKPIYVTTTIPPYDIDDFSQYYYILSIPKGFELHNDNRFVYLHMTSTDYCIKPIKYKKLLNPFDNGYVEENSIDLDVSSCTEFTNITVVLSYYIESDLIQREKFVIYIGVNPHYPSSISNIMITIFLSIGISLFVLVIVVLAVYKYKKYIENKKYDEEKFVLESHFVVDYPLIDP